MMTMIDQVANQNHLQLIKAMLPYLPPENQKNLCYCIKMMELQNISAFYRSHTCCAQSIEDSSSASPAEILTDIRNYCDESEQSIIDQLLQTLSMLELYSAMSKRTSDTMIFQNSFPENSASENRAFHDVSSESC